MFLGRLSVTYSLGLVLLQTFSNCNITCSLELASSQSVGFTEDF